MFAQKKPQKTRGTDQCYFPDKQITIFLLGEFLDVCMGCVVVTEDNIMAWEPKLYIFTFIFINAQVLEVCSCHRETESQGLLK